MQIPNNTIAAVISFYKKELSSVYSESELDNITRWVLQKQLHRKDIDPKDRISESDMTPLEQMCYDLKNHKPIQYVLGDAEFYGLHLEVNEHVLIPRPETEELVEKAIASLISSTSTPVPAPDYAPTILDIGTGSGCIAIALKKNIPQARVFALDVSGNALALARRNAAKNNVTVDFFEADVLNEQAASKILWATGQKKIDLIISNPPYVLKREEDGLHPRVREYEPHLALFVEDADPILFYKKIAKLTPSIANPGARLWFECHADHVITVHQMLLDRGFKVARIHPDLSGSSRFVEAFWL